MRWFPLSPMVVLLAASGLAMADSHNVGRSHEYGYADYHGHGNYDSDYSYGGNCNIDYYMSLWADYCHSQTKHSNFHCAPFGTHRAGCHCGLHGRTKSCGCGKLRGQSRCRHGAGGCAQCGNGPVEGVGAPAPVQPEVPPVEQWQEPEPGADESSGAVDPTAQDGDDQDGDESALPWKFPGETIFEPAVLTR